MVLLQVTHDGRADSIGQTLQRTRVLPDQGFQPRLAKWFFIRIGRHIVALTPSDSAAGGTASRVPKFPRLPRRTLHQTFLKRYD